MGHMSYYEVRRTRNDPTVDFAFRGNLCAFSATTIVSARNRGPSWGLGAGPMQLPEEILPARVKAGAPEVPVPPRAGPGCSEGAASTFGVTTDGVVFPDAVVEFSAREGEVPPPRSALPGTLRRGESVDAPDRGGPEPRPPLVAGVARGL